MIKLRAKLENTPLWISLIFTNQNIIHNQPEIRNSLTMILNLLISEKSLWIKTSIKIECRKLPTENKDLFVLSLTLTNIKNKILTCLLNVHNKSLMKRLWNLLKNLIRVLENLLTLCLEINLIDRRWCWFFFLNLLIHSWSLKGREFKKKLKN